VTPDLPTERSAYLLGRLFALIERIEAAALGEAPRETSDRQFGEASRAPAGCFPALLRAAHYYATRSNEGPWLERSAGEVLAKLPGGELPADLDREGRRAFALGYAHERAALFERLLSASRAAAPPANSPDPVER
jgi:CRISPR-associated protein Csd1